MSAHTLWPVVRCPVDRRRWTSVRWTGVRWPGVRHSTHVCLQDLHAWQHGRLQTLAKRECPTSWLCKILSFWPLKSTKKLELAPPPCLPKMAVAPPPPPPLAPWLAYFWCSIHSHHSAPYSSFPWIVKTNLGNSILIFCMHQLFFHKSCVGLNINRRKFLN